MEHDMDQVREFDVPPEYDARFDHFANFFDGVRDGKAVVEDPSVGFRAAAPALLANMSYFEGKTYRWDPDAMRIVT